MRLIFLLLLLANLGFFAYMQIRGDRTGESMRGHEPLHADKVRLLGFAPPPGAKKPVKPKPVPVCLEWGAFAGDKKERAVQAIEKLQLGDKLEVREVSQANSYWVLISPLNSKQDAEKKMAQVKALGIEDIALLPDNDKNRFAISLGIFSTEEAANNYLATLRDKGVRSAKMEVHAKGSKQTSFYVRDASEAVSAELVKIKVDFPGSELKAVACEGADNPQPAEEKK